MVVGLQAVEGVSNFGKRQLEQADPPRTTEPGRAFQALSWAASVRRCSALGQKGFVSLAQNFVLGGPGFADPAD